MWSRQEQHPVHTMVSVNRIQDGSEKSHNNMYGLQGDVTSTPPRLPKAVSPSEMEERMYMMTCGSRLAMKDM